MTSLQTSTRQVGTSGYYINVGSMIGQVYTSPVTSAGVPSTVAVTTWSASGTCVSTISASVTAGKAIFRDMGKTAVSSGVYFRRVQLIVPQANAGTTSTFGVGGPLSNGGDYLTGYVVSGFEGGGTPAPLAKFGV